MTARPILYIKLGEKVRELRKRKGWTQGELAEELDVTRTSITNIESGLQKTTVQKVVQMAIALDCESWDDILPPFSPNLQLEITNDLLERAMEIAMNQLLNGEA